jgi:tetratricopeptide (TPR) repeat protein
LKRTRVTLHVDFVRWADQINAQRGRELEFEEILGYHLEQAHKYLAELAPLDQEGWAIGKDGAARLASAGRRAFSRGDVRAAGNLLRRAIALLPPTDPERLPLLPELGEVLLELGEMSESRAVVDEALVGARIAGNREVEASARLARILIRLHSGEPGSWSGEALETTTALIPFLEQQGAHAELAKAWRLVALVQQNAGQLRRAGETIARVIEHARLAGDERLVARSALGLTLNAVYGPTPVVQAIEQCEALIGSDLADRQVQNLIICKIAELHAMNGDYETARRSARSAGSVLRDLGHGVRAASSSIDSAAIEMLAGDPVAAEWEMRAAFEMLARMGETYFLSTIAAMLARAVHTQGRDEEAMTLTETAERSAAEDDIDSQAQWRCVRALILARRGSCEEAEALVRRAINLASKTEALSLKASTLMDLATVLSFTERTEEARVAANDAIAIFAAKGDMSSVERAEEFLKRLK